MPARERDISFRFPEEEKKFREACKMVAQMLKRENRVRTLPLTVTSFKLTSEELVQLRRAASKLGWTPSAFCRQVITSICKEATNAG